MQYERNVIGFFFIFFHYSFNFIVSQRNGSCGIYQNAETLRQAIHK
jgi:hypothetical protein